MPGQGNRQAGFIKKGKLSRKKMVIQNSQGCKRNCLCTVVNNQFPQFDYYSRRGDHNKYNHPLYNNDDNQFTPFVYAKNSNPQQQQQSIITNKNHQIITSYIHRDNNINNRYVNSQQKRRYFQKQRIIQNPINQFAVNSSETTKPMGRLVTNGSGNVIDLVIKKPVNINTHSNRYNRKLNQQNNSINSISQLKNAINKVVNRQQQQLLLQQSSSSLSQSSLQSSIENNYQQQQQNKNYQYQVTQLNCVKQNIPKNYHKSFVLNDLHDYHQISQPLYLNHKTTIFEHKSTPQQIINQIQNRTQLLKHQQQIQQYQKQGISIAKGGLTFEIDIKQFVVDNNASSPNEYHSSQNQNSFKKETKNNQYITTRTNKNNIQYKKSKKNINSKQELKRRRKLAKSYDQYARQKVFRSQ